MGLGSDVRLARLFADDSRRLFGVAVDHFVGYGNVREGGLADLPRALDRVRPAPWNSHWNSSRRPSAAERAEP